MRRSSVRLRILPGVTAGVLHSALLLSVAWAQSPPAPAPAPPERPNIVLLIGDDHGWPYYGFMGSKDVRTPNLDLLAEQGVVFPLAHSTSTLCRPSLISLLTGLYPIQYFHRVQQLPPDKIKPREATGIFTQRQQELWAFAIQNFDTLPRLLAQNGYVSFQAGKLWEGPFELSGFTEGMSAEWNKSVIDKHGLLLAMAGGDGLEIGRKTMQPVFDFIDRHRDQPFFLWYAPMLPHVPFDPPYKYLKYYEGKGYSESAKKYYANCTWFDAGVGELMDFLQERGVLEKTLFVYASDNGWEQEPNLELKGHFDLTSFGGPLGKNSLHDFGFRTPLLFCRPGRTPAGARREGLASTIDIVPTILDYAGVKIPEELPGQSLRAVIEGRSELTRPCLIDTVEQLRGDRGWKEDFAYRGYALRTPRWHYALCRERGIEMLFDLSVDPMSSTNVVMDHPDLSREFSKRIEEWRDAMLSGTEAPGGEKPAAEPAKPSPAPEQPAVAR